MVHIRKIDERGNHKEVTGVLVFTGVFDNRITLKFMEGLKLGPDEQLIIDLDPEWRLEIPDYE